MKTMHTMLTLTAAALIGATSAASHAGTTFFGGSVFSNGGFSIQVGTGYASHSYRTIETYHAPVCAPVVVAPCEPPVVVIPRGTHHSDVVRHGNHTHTVHHHGGHVVDADRVHGNHVHVSNSNRGKSRGHSNGGHHH